MKPTDVLIDCVPDAERRRIARDKPGQPPPHWRVSMDGRAVLGLPTFEEAVDIALSWVAHTSSKIYRRPQPYGPPELYEPTA